LIGYIAACLVAVLVTSILLGQKYGRHPFGDEKSKAVGWWAGVALLDAAVAALLTTGAFAVVSLEELRHSAGFVRGALMGLFGPLAFRSPVRRVTIDGRPENVGATYIYDRVRIRLDRGLDERITRLRRADLNKLTDKVAELGWDDLALRGRLEEHIDALKNLRPGDRARLRQKISAVMTVPPGDRMRGLLRIALDERFTGVIDDIKSTSP
jgi:hypothetical protein